MSDETSEQKLEQLRRELDQLKVEYEKTWGVSWEEQSDLYQVVGMGITGWGLMESRLVQIASKLLGTTDAKAGLIFYSIINTHTWLNIIDELLTIDPAFSSYKTTFTSISSDIRRLNDLRVRLAHHYSRYDPSRPKPALRPSPFDVRSKSTKHGPLSTDEIMKFMKDVNTTTVKLQKLLEEILPVATSSK